MLEFFYLKILLCVYRRMNPILKFYLATLRKCQLCQYVFIRIFQRSNFTDQLLGWFTRGEETRWGWDRMGKGSVVDPHPTFFFYLNKDPDF
jgi:hypothetical protein